MQVKVSVLGHFGEGTTLLNGQTVKTKIITEELQRQLGQDQVMKIDTHGGWKTLLKAPFQVLRALKNSTNVLIFPAQNGLRVYAPLLACFRKWFPRRKLHYVMIGGWLPHFLTKRQQLAKRLKRFDAIYAETSVVKAALEKQGFTNVSVLPNCKKLTPLAEEELVYPSEMPYQLCTFSRVMKEKGIEDAVDAVRTVNEALGYQAFSLDVYGQIDAAQTEWFEGVKQQFPPYVRYCGCVNAEQSVEVLQHYFALLFPTRFYTEGVPGTIIDAYAAGIPVISARWESFADVIEEGVTGIGYELNHTNQLVDILFRVVQDPCVLSDMKKQCLYKAKEYLPEVVVRSILERFARISSR